MPSSQSLRSSSASSGLPSVSRLQRGYAQESVDPVLATARRTLMQDSADPPQLTAEQLAAVDFPRERGGYQIAAVDQRIARLITELQARERFRLPPARQPDAPPKAPITPAAVTTSPRSTPSST